ncbi:MAG: tetratricopeptide repeat protein [candidate division NC10 bacterium]|nr:tetratricopeptide repeat protein [candidate division NC10 bacterium]
MSRTSKARKRKVVPPREARGPVPRPSTQRWVHWLVPVLIAFITVGAFLPTLHNQFVSWDDDQTFLNNPHYRGLGWPQVRWMWTTFHMGHYVPLAWMTLGLDYLLWGMKPFGYHLTSLLLHATNAVVFYLVALRILGVARSGPGERDKLGLVVSAAFTALLFALHPLRVESVAWATERRDVLSALFYLLTVLVYLRTCERGERGRGAYYWGAVALFACALLSKSMALSLPVVLLILDVYPLRRLGGSTGWWGEDARRVYLEKLPFVLLAAAVSAIAFMAQLSVHAAISLTQLSALGRLSVAVYGLSFYLWKMVLPVNLSPLYELGTVSPWAPPFLLSYGVVLALTALALACRRRVPGLPAAWLAYVVILLPVLGIFQSGPQIAADRYTYQAGLGWALLAGAALLSGWRRRPALVTGPVICVLLGLGALTWNQVHVWHDSGNLWAHALAIDPTSSIAHNNLGSALADQGKLPEAVEHYRQALQIKPDYAGAHSNWGVALADQGKLAEAIEHYRQALQIKPNHAGAHNNWGLALARQGRLAEAIEHYRQALQIKPDHAGAHNNLGNALADQGKLPEAVEHYRQALQIKPDYADVHSNWGVALADQGRLAEAIEHYRQALQIKPDYAGAHNSWGVALARQGRLAEAIEHYRRAVELRPNFEDATSNLVNTLLRIQMGSDKSLTKPDAALSRKGKKVE